MCAWCVCVVCVVSTSKLAVMEALLAAGIFALFARFAPGATRRVLPIGMGLLSKAVKRKAAAKAQPQAAASQLAIVACRPAKRQHPDEDVEVTSGRKRAAKRQSDNLFALQNDALAWVTKYLHNHLEEVFLVKGRTATTRQGGA